MGAVGRSPFTANSKGTLILPSSIALSLQATPDEYCPCASAPCMQNIDDPE